jgi:hypothetical protein
MSINDMSTGSLRMTADASSNPGEIADTAVRPVEGASDARDATQVRIELSVQVQEMQENYYVEAQRIRKDLSSPLLDLRRAEIILLRIRTGYYRQPETVKEIAGSIRAQLIPDPF